MLLELAIRFVLGGLIVSTFATTGEVLRPKSFAGISAPRRPWLWRLWG
jgi:hypothetical protein